MKKLTFKVSSPKDNSIASLIKKINKISCRIVLDLENGYVVVEHVDDGDIDTVIDLVNEYYTLLGVDIDNTSEEVDKTAAEDEIAEENPTSELKADEGSNAEEEQVTEEPKNEVKVTAEPVKPKEWQNPDEMVFDEVKFENAYVQERINNFLKTAYWAMYRQGATEKEIGEYILSIMSEISIRYGSKPKIEFSIGDVVDVTYGTHLPGEIIGGHVHAVVCDILNAEMAFVAPITKARTDLTSRSYFYIDAPEDVTYVNPRYSGGTVLLDKGRYIRAERFNSVVGKLNPEYFEVLLSKLATTFDFTPEFVQLQMAEDTEESENGTEETVFEETVSKGEEHIEEATVEETTEEVITELSPDESQEQIDEPMIPKKTVEAAVKEIVGEALQEVDTSKKVQTQVDTFMENIGMITDDPLVKAAFVAACEIKKINYENIIVEVKENYPQQTESGIKNTLSKAFKDWLIQYPALAEEYPKISFMVLLKVFAKKFKK